MCKAVWANPREITDVKHCYFYHTMDIPGFGDIEMNYHRQTHFNQRDGILNHTIVGHWKGKSSGIMRGNINKLTADCEQIIHNEILLEKVSFRKMVIHLLKHLGQKLGVS